MTACDGTTYPLASSAPQIALNSAQTDGELNSNHDNPLCIRIVVLNISNEHSIDDDVIISPSSNEHSINDDAIICQGTNTLQTLPNFHKPSTAVLMTPQKFMPGFILQSG